MTLIAILLVLAIERFIGAVDHLRGFGWYHAWWRWLENRLARQSLWQGAGGVIVVVLPPLLILALASVALYSVSPVLDFILACAVLLYSLGPADLGHQVTRYTEALNAGDEAAAEEARREFHNPRWEDQGPLGSTLCSLLGQTNLRLFAVLFWFVVLGPVGALLYRLSAELHKHYADVHGGFADAVRDLYNLLNWPTTRLSALGFALAGNLVEALDGWRRAEARSLAVNETVLIESGLGALQFRQLYGDESDDAGPGMAVTAPDPEDIVSWVEAARNLETRTLIVWLSVLAIMTIAGVAS